MPHDRSIPAGVLHVTYLALAVVVKQTLGVPEIVIAVVSADLTGKGKCTDAPSAWRYRPAAARQIARARLIAANKARHRRSQVIQQTGVSTTNPWNVATFPG